MKNFARAVRVALNYPWTVAGTVVCAVMVAVLWGGSISAVYPVVEVVLRGQSMSQWADNRIAYGEKTKADFAGKVAYVESVLATPAGPARHDALNRRLTDLQQIPAGQRDHVQSTEITELGQLLRIESDDRQRQFLRDLLASAKNRVEAEEVELARVRWIQPYIKAYTPTGAFQTLTFVLVFLLAGTLLKDVFLIASAILVARLVQLTTLDLRQTFFACALRMDLTSHGGQGHGDLMSRFTGDIGAVAGGVASLFGRALREPLKMTACFVGAAMVCWRLLLFSLVVAPLAAWLISRLAKSLKRANRRALEEMAEIYNRLSETLLGIKVVKAFTMEPYEQRRFANTANHYYRKAMKIARYGSLISPLNELMGMIMIVLAVLVGAYLSLNHETHLFGIKISDRRLTTGACMLFYGLLAGVSDPARRLAGVFASLQVASAAADRVYAVLDRKPKVADPVTPRPLPQHRKEIRFDNIHFHYDPQQRVLENVTLRIAFGETIGIVGPNGCGKSTLANLIPRFFDPVRGSVQLDGTDLRDVRQEDLRKQIGMVTQETLLFDDTIFDNIRYGTPEASREDVLNAARRAHAHRFIEEKLTEGYETRVGMGGQRLSGGQRQRIALARAILRDPAILILDEATSQIDLESERLIQQALQQFIVNRTTILITHRLSTLALADRIVVMDHGRILDTGTHQQLIARCDLYQRIHQTDLKRSA